jgi:conflict system STAND superfamily ATPase/CHAT domain-containing protein
LAGIDYLDFELEVAPAVDGEYPLRVRSRAGETRGSMRLPFDRGTLDDRLRAVQARLIEAPTPARGGGAQRPATEPATAPASDADIQALGAELFEALFRGQVRALLGASQRQAEGRHEGLRIRLRLDAPDLAALPWEFLYDGDRGDYLTLAASTPLVRYVAREAPAEPLRVRPPLRILGVVASPTGLKPLNVDRERQRLELALEGARGRGAVELVWLGGQTARYLQAALRQGPWHILHFIGHGGFNPEKGEGLIVLADDEGGPHVVYATNLARLVADHDPMRVVVLNACDGARANEVDLFSSTAALLVKQGTPAVVAMQFEITDDAAIEFSRSFYEALADGYAVDTSLGEARKGMALHLGDSLEWGTPVLYTHAADGVLFSVAKVRQPAEPKGPAGSSKPAMVFGPTDAAAATALAAALDRAHHVAPTRIATGSATARLAGAGACLLLHGPLGTPVWEVPAVERILSRRSHDRDFKIAPILLPGSVLPDLGQLPDFLVGREWVDLRDGIDDPARLTQVLEALSLGADQPVQAALPSDVPPFRGLEVFDEEHAGMFFGREALTQQLVEHLRADRFLGVVGPSGSGKSSVVRAGLVPQLRRGALPGSASWPILVMRPGNHPLETLALRLATVATPDAGASADAAASRRDDVLTGLLQGDRGLDAIVDAALAGAPADRRVVLVVDQFEEVFTLARDQAERERFVNLLLEATRIPTGRAMVVITMRADFMDDAAAIPSLAAMLAEHDVLVTPMTRDELRRAIVEPARRAGLQYEAGLVDTIMAEVGGESGALPLLEDTLLELWQGRAGGWLTLARYREIGGVRGAIAKRADSVYDGLSAPQRDIARRILLRLVSLGSGSDVTRRRATLAELQPGSADPEAADVATVLQELIAARLIITSRDVAGDVVDLAHEALINNWPTFRTWIEENRAALRLHRRIAEIAGEWDTAQRDPSYLLRGARLVEATTWADQNPRDLNDLERAFVTAGADADRAEQRARRNRLRRLAAAAVGVIAVLAVLAGVAGWFAVQADAARGREERAKLVAEQAQLVAEAQATSAKGAAELAKPLVGLGQTLDGFVLAGRAGLSPADFRQPVMDNLASGRIATIGTGVERLFRSPDGRYLIVDVAGGPGTINRMADGSVVATLTSSVSNVVFGPAAAGVAGVTYDDAPGELRRLDTGEVVLAGDAATGVEPDFGFPTEPGAGVMILAWHDPTSSGKAPNAEVRSLADGSLVRSLGGAAAAPPVMLAAADGGRALMTFDDRHDELLELSGGKTVASFDDLGFISLPERGPATVFSTVQSLGDTTTCQVRRSSDGTVLTANPKWVVHDARVDPCGIVSVSDDGLTAAISGPKRVKLIRIADPSEVLAATASDLIYVAIAPGSDRPGFLAFSRAGVEIWRSGDGAPVGVYAGSTPDEFSADPDVLFSADGAYASFLLDGSRQLVRMATGERFILPEQQVSGNPIDNVKGIAFGVGTKGDVAFLIRGPGDGDVVLLDGLAPDGVGGAGPRGQVAFWPGTVPGPAIGYSLNDWGPTLGLQIVAVASFQSVVFGPGEDPRIAVVEFHPADANAGRAGTPSILVLRDGTIVPLRAQVASVDFSPDPETSGFVLTFADEVSEIWDRSRSASIGSLGLGVGDTRFDATGDRLVVRYLTGATVVIDVQRLRTLPPDLRALSDADFVALVCGTLGDQAATLAPVACGVTP